MANHRVADFIVGAATVVTLVIVFMLQHTQYYDTRALHAKIDELILSLEGPRDELAGIEHRALHELNENPQRGG
jgi:low affinity Fe/Cu permease